MLNWVYLVKEALSVISYEIPQDTTPGPVLFSTNMTNLVQITKQICKRVAVVNINRNSNVRRLIH